MRRWRSRSVRAVATSLLRDFIVIQYLGVGWVVGVAIRAVVRKQRFE